MRKNRERDAYRRTVEGAKGLDKNRQMDKTIFSVIHNEVVDAETHAIRERARREQDALRLEREESGDRPAAEEAGNAPFCVSQEKSHTAVSRGVRRIYEAP